MITDEEIRDVCAKFPGEHVTEEYMKSRIDSLSYRTEGTLTTCLITLDNGYYIIGKSACVDAMNFDPEFGQKLAYKNAFNKLWPLFGFLLAEKRFREHQP